MNIKEFASELRARFEQLLDVETGDGACALSLLDALEKEADPNKFQGATLDSFFNYYLPESQVEELKNDNELEPLNTELKDLSEHVADMTDMLLEMILLNNNRLNILEGNAENNQLDNK